MQNKPNFLHAQMNVSPVKTMNYEQMTMNNEPKNKPNQSQFFARQAHPKPKQTQFTPLSASPASSIRHLPFAIHHSPVTIHHWCGGMYNRLCRQAHAAGSKQQPVLTDRIRWAKEN
jgi:hypothetical protein